jgi:hypothetical protein
MNGAATVRERLYLARYPSSTFATAQKMPKRSRDREGAVVSGTLSLFDVRGRAEIPIQPLPNPA